VIRAGTVDAAIAAFEHAAALAHGQAPADDRRTPPPKTIPRADMRAANRIADVLLEQFQEWHRRGQGAFPSNVAHPVHALIGSAEDAARRLESQTRAESSPPSDATVPALLTGWLTVWVNNVNAAREPFEIAAGERPLAGSTIALAAEGHAESVEGLLVLMPGLGELVMAYEVVRGKSLLSGRQLSAEERIWTAVAAVIPFVVGRAIRGVVRAATVTRRAVLVALASRGFFRALTTSRRGTLTLRLTIGLRLLPERDFQQLLVILKGTARMTVQESNHLNYCLARIDTVSILAQWLAHAERELGAVTRGFHSLRGAQHTDTERAAFKLLADKSGKRVVALPEILPEQYPGGRQLPGVKHPDVVWGEELADFKEVKGGSAADQIKYIGKKSTQANTAVVTFADTSRLTPADILPHMERLWANPDFAYLKQVVFLTDKGMQVVDRPTPYVLAFTQGVARVPYPAAKVAIPIVRAVQSEPEGDPVGDPAR